MIDVSGLRQNYLRAALYRADLEQNPIAQFQKWFSEAAQCPEVLEPNAMTLSTATPDGIHARVVLLKGVESGGFRFFTNYESRKGRQMRENPHAALSFFWAPLERQVLISGIVKKLPMEISEAYFHSRPRESQIGAWVSPQSSVIENRAFLERRFAEVEDQYAGKTIPLPPNWGGFVVEPREVEFWQGRASRLHDRLRYILEDSHWTIQRLAP